jgi:hypothetical protein
MVRKVFICVIAALALLVVTGAGAATAPKIDLSTQSAVDALLRAKGIDPATVVKQIGPLNYAGPNCPGPDWNCTTSTRVVQLSEEGDHQHDNGQNQFVCNPPASGTNPATNTCVIMQGGKTNTAHCNEGASTEPLAALSCDITQSGDINVAEVVQHVTQNNGPVQNAELTTSVHQDAIEKNVSVIHQDVNQKTSLGVTQTQNAYEQVDLQQSVSGSQNFSHIHQTEDQSESGSATSQNQNTDPNPAFDCGAEKPGSPNQCANVRQYAIPNGGTNVSQLNQQNGQRQTSSALTPSQTQGNAQGGQEGNVHQENPVGVGVNINLPDQDLRQQQSSPGGIAFQKQVTDPGCCGFGTEVGGAKINEDIDQATTQSADETAAEQNAILFGETHHVSGDVEPGFATTTTTTPSDHCEITHMGRNNAGGTTFSVSGDSQTACAGLTLATECQYPSEGQPCFPTEVCTECTEGPLGATLGAAIPMPDYSSDPSDYVAAPL